MTRKLMWMLGMVLASPPAMAEGFQAKTSREALSTRQVERGLLIGKTWLEFGVGSDVKIAHGQWSPEGEAIQWDGVKWTYTTQHLRVRYGLFHRGEIYWDIQTHYVNLQNDNLGTDTSGFGLGDPHFGYKWEIFHSMAPLTSVILYADYKAPAGNESPGNYVGGPSTYTNFVMSTGQPDETIGLRGKRQVGPAALTLGGSYMHRSSNITQWAIETDMNQFAGRIKPGDVVQLDGDLLLQLGPVALNGGAIFKLRDQFRVGTTAPGWFPAKDLKPVAGSDGWSLDAVGALTFNATRGVDFVAAAQIPLRGEDLDFFPLEEIHPTLGNTYSGTFEFRY